METLRFVACGREDEGARPLSERLLSAGWRSVATPLAAWLGEEGPGGSSHVSWRWFASAGRRFALADFCGAPSGFGDFAGAAASADLALVFVDVARGLLPDEARLQCRILAMMGVRHVVLVVGDMASCAFDQAGFDRAVADFHALTGDSGWLGVQAIPVSGGLDNIAQPSPRMAWYRGPTLLQYLASADAGPAPSAAPFRMPVLGVEPAADPVSRRYSGCVAAGSVRPGDAVLVLPTGLPARIGEVFAGNVPCPVALAGDAVALSLAEGGEVHAGDVLVATDARPEVADQFEARLLWVGEPSLMPGRQYVLKHGGREVEATVSLIKYCEDASSGAHLAAKTLRRNEIAVVNLACSQPLVFEDFLCNRVMGRFVLLEKATSELLGVGVINFALRRANNIHWQALELNKAERARQKQQVPRCVWFTGLSGSGKSTLANLLDKRLFAEGYHTYVLDGDNVRHGLNRNLGFTEADRIENIRRVAEVARLMVDAGLIVLVSFISPFTAERSMARNLFAPGEFVEVFVDAPLDECERRDVKGLYAKARRGELKNFTGIDSPYEVPLHPDVHLPTAELSLDQCVDRLMLALG